eukprot:CAMPEP_0178901900 /NCGR_PEP_ID=MMETSP0786-20121207/4301_1 /TAXON_ID=186022 /ORGANISM="Thalassionema frauenfeldii, Strain CCMP 1798" /LENGTH=53 /DNA_ID=CAMNT_0020573097 /DNA_START=342 /DNA_END=500 /DNA_ORIENTATION=+
MTEVKATWMKTELTHPEFLLFGDEVGTSTSSSSSSSLSSSSSPGSVLLSIKSS